MNKRNQRKIIKATQIPNITADFWTIGSEEAATVLNELHALSVSLSSPINPPTLEPRAVAAVLNQLYTQDEFYELMSTPVGKGVIIGTILTSYLYSALATQGVELNEITNTYSTIAKYSE